MERLEAGGSGWEVGGSLQRRVPCTGQGSGAASARLDRFFTCKMKTGLLP